MQPLSTRQKQFLYHHCVYGALRPVAKPLYDALMATILSANRLLDGFSRTDRADISSLTLIIKTFERPYAVRRLVKSIKRLYADANIIVVDDSREPGNIEGVTNIAMPYDSGISAGRNRALDETTTPYFLLLDDDFVFSRRQKLGELVAALDQHSRIDILGGRCIDLPLFIKHAVQQVEVPSKEKPLLALGTNLGGHLVVDKVPNFFIARTEKIRQLRWKDELKLYEHAEFFGRARGRLVTAYKDDMLILHAKTPFDVAYNRKRFRS